MARLNETLRKYYSPGGRKDFLQDMTQAALAMLSALTLFIMM